MARRSYTLRDLKQLDARLEARDGERDRTVAEVARQLALVVEQQRLILAALGFGPRPAAPVAMPPLDVGAVIVLADVELEALLERAA